ncbi:hypothetical protein [Pseudomonas sp. IAC-BECa141]|uniref:hypothetical protein n=1 Tax=Pseudomonas sp. IAC-BECa141 TaxID=2793103 RepID=UPI001D08DEAA|nr:hypothetical protein [Pseudomonas sp. IAC-BECa141]UDI95310.1 hypothetical protein I5961_12685 [Pseudomonas sp. IAC-BECa141]
MIFIVFIADVVIAVRSKDESFSSGVFGDFFGGVTNPILTFFAFMGLLITITIQRVELKESRLELAKSANALDQQVENFKVQNSVATFYKMIDTHMAALAAIDLVDDNNKVTKGRDCIKIFCKRLHSSFVKSTAAPENPYVKVTGTLNLKPRRDEFRGVVAAFDHFWDSDGEELQQYLAGVEITLSYVDSFLEGNKLYVDMYKSLFSDSEKLLIFYYAVVCGTDHLKELLVKYSFCVGVPQNRLLDRAHVLGLPILSL